MLNVPRGTPTWFDREILYNKHKMRTNDKL